MKYVLLLAVICSLTACKKDEKEYRYNDTDGYGSTGGGGGGNTTIINNNNNNNNNGGANGSGGSQSEVNLEPVSGGAFGVAVNRAKISVESVSGNRMAVAHLYAGSASVGTYYGSGNGNKIIMSFAHANNLRVDQFQSLSFKQYIPPASANARGLYVNILVDANCSSLNPDLFLATSVATLNNTVGSWVTPGVAANQPVWQAVGAKCGMPVHNGASYAPLTDILSSCPQACIVEDVTLDNGMPKHTALGGVMLIHGDSVTTTPSDVYVDDVSITTTSSTQVYEFN